LLLIPRTLPFAGDDIPRQKGSLNRNGIYYSTREEGDIITAVMEQAAYITTDANFNKKLLAGGILYVKQR